MLSRLRLAASPIFTLSLFCESQNRDCRQDYRHDEQRCESNSKHSLFHLNHLLLLPLGFYM